MQRNHGVVMMRSTTAVPRADYECRCNVASALAMRPRTQDTTGYPGGFSRETEFIIIFWEKIAVRFVFFIKVNL
jgi:hypothetical protein